MAAACRSDYVENLAVVVDGLRGDAAIAAALANAFATIPENAAALAHELEDLPDLQATLANLTGYTPSVWLVGCELKEIGERRRVFGIDPISTAGGPLAALASAFTGGVMGVCCSGGGIRSATFSLGILQALAELKLLRSIDYLSSVSGGGYIHQWLAAWLRRQSPHDRSDATTRQAFETVNQHLIPPPDPARVDPQPQPLRWLRRYSNYLTPRRGVFSGDTWAAAAIWLRNTLLIQVILISGLLALLMVPHLFAPPPEIIGFPWSPSAALFARAAQLAVVLIVLLMIVPTAFAARNLADFTPCGGATRLLDDSGVRTYIVQSLLVWAILWTVLQESIWVSPMAFVLFAVFGLAITFAGGALRAYISIHTFNHVKPALWKRALAAAGFGLIVAAAAAVGTMWTMGTRRLLVDILPSRVAGIDAWRLSLVFGPPMYLAAAMAALIVLVGLIGRPFHDPRREWLARFMAWVGLYAAVWIALVGVSLFGHAFVEWAFRRSGNLQIDTRTALPAIVGWLGVSTGGVLAGSSTRTSGQAASNAEARSTGAMEWLATIGPYVFIAGLLVILAWCADEAMAAAYRKGAVFAPLAIVGVLAVCAIVGWRVDINEFSLHAFYRNRLARCYLGASNPSRKPNPFTAFDDEDAAIKVSHLTASEGYPGPFPIFCTALNITVGEDLAWQERKAASFAFTPLYSGYYVDWTEAKGRHRDVRFNSFVETAKYAYPAGGVALSTAAAVSGAALSPSWGYHTKPATAFVMTLFNARLGWWLRNPRGLEADGTRRGATIDRALPSPSPHFAVGRLALELFGQVNDTSDYVYLSDGGHFDNMGLYELVRRGCRYIVICDGEQDPELEFDGVATAIRKCRADFGVEIELDVRALERRQDSIYSTRHVVVGEIRYPGLGGANGDAGIIVYLKSSLTGDEPADVLSYRKEHSAFPHDSTTNQWFNESQFESYRALGHHVGLSAFEPAGDAPSCHDLGHRFEYFKRLKDIWYPPTAEMERYQAAHAARYDTLLQQVRAEPRLSGLMDRLFAPGDGRWTLGREQASVEYARSFAPELLQFAWTVYTELNLVQPKNLAHPHSQGWIRIFWKWCHVDVVRDGWTTTRDSYSPQFHLFANANLGLPLP